MLYSNSKLLASENTFKMFFSPWFFRKRKPKQHTTRSGISFTSFSDTEHVKYLRKYYLATLERNTDNISGQTYRIK